VRIDALKERVGTLERIAAIQAGVVLLLAISFLLYNAGI
jgi:hypothetical protein